MCLPDHRVDKPSQAASTQAQQLQRVHKYSKYWNMFGNLVLAKISRQKYPRELELHTQFLTFTLPSHWCETVSVK